MENSGNFLHFFSVFNGVTKKNLPKKPVAGLLYAACPRVQRNGIPPFVARWRNIIPSYKCKQKIPSGQAGRDNFLRREIGCCLPTYLLPDKSGNGIGTLITFALNVVRLPRRQRAGPSAFLDKSAPTRAGTMFKELPQSWAPASHAAKR